jgi:YHS domain-containing protein
MSFLSRVMRFLFWLLVLSWSVTLVRRLVTWMLRDATTASQQHAAGSSSNQGVAAPRRLVRDPICGVHMAEVLAIPLREGGETLYFCSIACRDQYVASTKKFAANG